MEANTYEGRLAKITGRFNIMLALVVGLLISNIILGVLLWYSFHNQRLEITPFASSSSYIKSPRQVDLNYLNMMSENFVFLRLNITPENVAANYKKLLSFVLPNSYATIFNSLSKEAKVIGTKKITSFFAIESFNSDPQNLVTKVTGILHRYVGERALANERLIYTLQYRYIQGRLYIVSFTKEKARA